MGVVVLKAVDRVSITTLVDNNVDVLMPDFGPVRRWGPVGTAGPVPVIAADLAEGGKSADFVKAEHGYSALVETRSEGVSIGFSSTPESVPMALLTISTASPFLLRRLRG